MKLYPKHKLLERRNSFYWGVVGGGIMMLLFPQTQIEGGAFIIAGVVGLVMSFITGEVAEKLYSTIREEGQKTREVILQDNQKTRDILEDILAVLRDIRNK